jgi:hypothetical protein
MWKNEECFFSRNFYKENILFYNIPVSVAKYWKKVQIFAWNYKSQVLSYAYSCLKKITFSQNDKEWVILVSNSSFRFFYIVLILTRFYMKWLFLRQAGYTE